MNAAIHIDGEPYTYGAEANAGISLSTGDRWWGTLVKWRRGTSGKWNRFTAVDVHPMDEAAVESCLRSYLARGAGTPPA